MTIMLPVGRWAQAIAVESVRANGEREQGTVKSSHIGLADSPFQRLARHGELAPRDQHRNAILAAAGERYRELWYQAGQVGLVALDMTHETRGAFPSMPFSEQQAVKRDQYRRARQALPRPSRRP
jgi:hypothetical protein